MNFQKTDIITLTGAASAAYLLGKYANKHDKGKLMIACYAVSGLALGAGITELTMLKTGVKKNEGWNDLVVPIYILFGVGLLTVSEVAYRILRK